MSLQVRRGDASPIVVSSEWWTTLEIAYYAARAEGFRWYVRKVNGHWIAMPHPPRVVVAR